VIEKVYDIDPGEGQVLVPGAGWTFDVSGADVTTNSEGRVAVDLATVNGSVSVDITEDSPPAGLGDGWTMAGGSCTVTADLVPPPAVGASRGTPNLTGGAITGIVVNAGETVTCTFVNESGDTLVATATPRITPPPTATLPITGTPGGDSWRIALLAIAGLLATILLLTPATPVRSRRRR
jgi:hypothetical protein